MKIVLDTQVFFSGLLFWGPANQILRGWRDGRLKIVLSPEIFEEYKKVGRELESSYEALRVSPFLELLVAHAQMVHSPSILPPIREDPWDNIFLACALAGKANCVVSGDRHLHKLQAFQGIKILRPRQFVQTCLQRR